MTLKGANNLKILVLSASNVGNKTGIVTQKAYEMLQAKHSEHDLTYLNLKDKELIFSDGRNYLDYTGDTLEVTQAVMAADVIILGTPIFQASIPGVLKNLFDLLPQNALLDKTVSMIVTAGSDKHFLVAEQQLKPILAYMKANVLQNYVFVRDIDFGLDGIENDDIYFRLDTLVEDAVMLGKTYQEVLQAKEAAFGF